MSRTRVHQKDDDKGKERKQRHTKSYSYILKSMYMVLKQEDLEARGLVFTGINYITPSP